MPVSATGIAQLTAHHPHSARTRTGPEHSSPPLVPNLTRLELATFLVPRPSTEAGAAGGGAVHGAAGGVAHGAAGAAAAANPGPDAIDHAGRLPGERKREQRFVAAQLAAVELCAVAPGSHVVVIFETSLPGSDTAQNVLAAKMVGVPVCLARILPYPAGLDTTQPGALCPLQWLRCNRPVISGSQLGLYDRPWVDWELKVGRGRATHTVPWTGDAPRSSFLVVPVPGGSDIVNVEKRGTVSYATLTKPALDLLADVRAHDVQFDKFSRRKKR